MLHQYALGSHVSTRLNVSFSLRLMFLMTNDGIALVIGFVNSLLVSLEWSDYTEK